MNKKIDKVLACVDFFDYSSMVLEYAVELTQDSHIVVYNVINQLDVDSFEIVKIDTTDNLSVEEFVENKRKERERMIKELIRNHFFNHKSRMSYLVDVGVPSIEILKTVDREEIDLIVMANKGKGSIAMVLFGSAAEKVFRHSPVPVVSVRDRRKFKRENEIC